MRGRYEVYWIIAAFLVAVFGTGLLLNPHEPTAYPLREIKIIPYESSVPSDDIMLLKDIASQDFPDANVSVEKPVQIPRNAYEHGMRQLDAYVLLSNLLKNPEGETVRVIGVTTMDLSIPRFSFVFSNVERGKNVMVMSLKRITTEDVNLKRERYRKIMLRALGLSFGFKTSNDRTCVMAFSRSLEELDAKGAKWCGMEAEEIKNITEVSASRSL